MKLVSIRSYWRLCIPQRRNVWETILEYTGSNVLFTLICRVSNNTYSLSRYAGAHDRLPEEKKHFPSKYVIRKISMIEPKIQVY